MLHVNDDINDDWFRQAAEHYPLKTDNPDWNAMYQKLHPGTETVPEGKKKRGVYLLLLLLLPILFIVIQTKKSPSASGKHTTAQTAPSAAEKNKTVEQDIQSAGLSSAPLTATENIKPAAPASQLSANITGLISFKNTGRPGITGSHSNISSSKSRTEMQVENAQSEEGITDISSGKKRPDVNATEKNKIINETVQANQIDPEKISGKLPVQVTVKNNSTDSAAKKKADLLQTDKSTTTAGKKPGEKNKGSQKHFYVGVIGGPDFSSVKLQSVKKVGFGLGLLAGYRVTKRMSIEAGFIKDKKYYNTDGEYFSTKKLNLSAAVKLDHATGSCNMWELPVNIHYALHNGKRSTVFASAGMSSYFMKSESYVYDLTYYNYTYPKNYNYKNKSNNFLAVVNLSAGYTHKIGKIGDLRIEPYVKLPVSKIGTGSLPIQSAGVYIGFTKNIF